MSIRLSQNLTSQILTCFSHSWLLGPSIGSKKVNTSKFWVETAQYRLNYYPTIYFFIVFSSNVSIPRFFNFTVERKSSEYEWTRDWKIFWVNCPSIDVYITLSSCFLTLKEHTSKCLAFHNRKLWDCDWCPFCSSDLLDLSKLLWFRSESENCGLSRSTHKFNHIWLVFSQMSFG